MIKDIWTIIVLLFTTSPKNVNLDSLELLETKYFPRSGYKYMMWCGKLLYRKSQRSSIMNSVGTVRFEREMTHEKIHLAQAKATGSCWVVYYLKYLWQWVKGCPLRTPGNGAYYTNPYEIEAYANEDNPEYPLNYTLYNLKSRYTLKNRKNLWISNSDNWKKWIKNL